MKLRICELLISPFEGAHTHDVSAMPSRFEVEGGEITALEVG